MLGREECGEASDAERLLSRLLQPLVKLTTAKDAVASASEVLEAFGGAGYVEDTGLPALLRDAQVFPIWEGTTNVLALDVLRVARGTDALEVFGEEFARLKHTVSAAELTSALEVATAAQTAASSWYRSLGDDIDELERGARTFSFTLARSYALALVVEHGQWLLDRDDDRGIETARRVAVSVLAHSRRFYSA